MTPITPGKETNASLASRNSTLPQIRPPNCVLLGGDEDSQSDDISKAKEFWEDYIERGKVDGEKG